MNKKVESFFNKMSAWILVFTLAGLLIFLGFFFADLLLHLFRFMVNYTFFFIVVWAALLGFSIYWIYYKD